jgi:bacterioferritin-associated ferredoxin
MYVCHCEQVSDRTIDATIKSGACSIDDLGELCGAGSNCGGCHSALQSLLDAVLPSKSLVSSSAA